MPVPLCPPPGFDQDLLEAIQDVADGCAPAGSCWLANFQRASPNWFGLIGRCDDFGIATGQRMVQFQSQLLAAGFHCDAYATLVIEPCRTWGVAVWNPGRASCDDHAVVRAIARQCGFRC